MPTIQLKDGNGTLYNFQASGDGSTENPFVPLSDLSVAGVSVTEANPLPSSGVSDWIMRRLFRAIGRLTFDASNQLRAAVAGTVAISSGTVTTVSTVSAMTTGNISIGDAGKPATAQMFTQQLSTGSTRRNLIRS